MDQRYNLGDTWLTPTRRGFILALGGGAASWPLAARAQQRERMHRLGILMGYEEGLEPFFQELVRLGWSEGENIRIDRRFAAGDRTLYETYAAELVGLSPDAFLANGTPAVAALRQQTHTVPIVFLSMADPVGQGFVQSLARPGGNITGFSAIDPRIMGKWIQLLKEIAPRVTHVAVIFNPKTAPFAPLLNREIEAVAPSLAVGVTLAPVQDEAEIERVVAAQAREVGGGLIALWEPFTIAHRDVIIAAASRQGLPLVGGSPDFTNAGSLISYVPDLTVQNAQAASYIDRVLRGTNPADLPVQQPATYSLVINLKTAKALGLTVPQALLARADEVIE